MRRDFLDAVTCSHRPHPSRPWSSGFYVNGRTLTPSVSFESPSPPENELSGGLRRDLNRFWCDLNPFLSG
ncbi:hypothetical protein J5N97_019630 [Dioscorea zingiberensis]|uniref:Uncharacterized protein n=1 Tax=Dioscorea zingiberensis TaxID=325984 RepID=A0A9D5HCH1_9LILI|nr:hypothetical protein J5N97_019630 [Dioscorea zingiberensis]